MTEPASSRACARSSARTRYRHASRIAPTLTNNSVWAFEITPTATGSRITERRLVPQDGTTWISETIVAHVLGGEEGFDDEMLDGMNATLAKIKAAVEGAE
jgi:hypothetical protein